MEPTLSVNAEILRFPQCEDPTERKVLCSKRASFYPILRVSCSSKNVQTMNVGHHLSG
jgi:hypothetical protein